MSGGGEDEKYVVLLREYVLGESVKLAMLRGDRVSEPSKFAVLLRDWFDGPVEFAVSLRDVVGERGWKKDAAPPTFDMVAASRGKASTRGAG